MAGLGRLAEAEPLIDTLERNGARLDRAWMLAVGARRRAMQPGQLQRRQRHKDAAAAILHEALDVFEDLGTPLWAGRARVELGRTNVGMPRTAGLTRPSSGSLSSPPRG